ncbi:hypothetical protein K1719_023145 [Acacia pycnantha]|nr:hypothetical protein K1719_023145 [Acacia pycnantha]
MKIKEAQKRNETQIDPIVEQWVQKANKLIQQETTPKKWFSPYSLAKKWERMAQEIPTMMEKAENFSHVAHAAERPGMEFYSQEFMHFKSRNSVFEQLMEELKDGNKYRIGLQAMGGSGKTTMAKAVGKELENSEAFDKVIFIEVPNPVDEKKIQDEIEKKLDLKIDDDEKKNLTPAEQIWTRIKNAGKVLIILDDVWQKFNLENIGIHHGIHAEGRCCVLLTTRYETVCTRMGCQKTINLKVLPEEDAVDLFLHHASESGKECPNKLKNLASKIVGKCGRLPVIVVAVAKTFRNWDPNEWEDAFATIEEDSSFRHGNIDEELNKFYNSLKISFRHLDPRAQDLILLCSIFPRSYEIPVELLSRIAIGLGLCENVDSYCRARSHVLSIKTTLVSSALLLIATEGCVKMHDVIREVAQLIADEKIQEIRNSETKLKENVKYSSWTLNDFSNYLEGNNIEVLLVWVNENDSLEVPNTFFEGMKGLRVLLLCSNVKIGRTVALSLPESIHSLENIQTLSLTNWELGEISILQNLKNLQILELTNCSIVELPNSVSRLEKLRWLGLVRCSIKKSNPFEVIGRCRKLGVLNYVSNDDTLNSNAKPSKIIHLPEFETYHIEVSSSSRRSFQLDASTKRYFNSTKLSGVLSESTVKFLAARAEILELIECNETRWTNLIPIMVRPIEDGGMNDLIRLSLESCPVMQRLIYSNGIPSDVAIFSNLVELRLHDMPVRELCHGHFPLDFLKKLEKLSLSHCDKLDGTLFKGKLELSNLESIKLVDCSMTCLFHLSTAQTLRQLENLFITRCSKLECLIGDDERAEQKVDDHQDPNQKDHHSVFLKLKFLKVRECHELDFILPISPYKELESVKIDDCNELNYIFGKCLNEGALHQMEKETILPLLQKIKIAKVPKFINIYPEYHLLQPSQVQKSWGPMCCFSSKASALNIDEQSFSKANQQDRTQASKEKHLGRVGGLLTLPLYPFKNLRKMTIEGFSELKSLLSLSIASSLKLMETLKVKRCAFYSRDFKRLEHVNIWRADKMKYVFGKCRADQDHNVQSELALPALNKLCLDVLPNMKREDLSNRKDFKDLEVVWIKEAKSIKYVFGKCRADQDHNVQSKLNFPALKRLYLEDVQNMALSFKERGKPLSNLRELRDSRDIYVEPKNILSFQNLYRLRFGGCKQLKFILSASTARSMPGLRYLFISDCEELVSIIEDDEQNQQNPLDLHQGCFPMLRRIQVKQCKKLKCLFSTSTCPKLPRLLILEIEDAPELVQVFEWKQGAPQELVIKDVLPNLLGIRLINLPSLHPIYQGFDFQALKVRLVRDCGNIPSANVSSSELFELCASLRQDQVNFLDSDDYFHTHDIIFEWAFQMQREEESVKALERDKTIYEQNNSTLNLEDSEEASKEADEKDSTIQKQESSSPNLTEIEEEGSQDIVNDSTMSQQNTASPNIGKSKEVSKEIAKNDSTTHKQKSNLSNLTENTETSKNEIVEEQLPTSNAAATPSSKSNRIEEEGSQQDIVNDSTMPQQNNGSPKFENSAEVLKEIAEENSTTNSNLLNLTKSEEASKDADEKDSTIQKQESSSPNLTEVEEKGSQEYIGNDSTMPQQNDASPNFDNSKEVSKEIAKNDFSTHKQNSNLSNLIENSETSKNEIVDEQLPTSNATATPSSKYSRELCGKESMDGQQALGESRSSNETPQRVEEPSNIECSSKDTSNERTLTIPPSITETTSPLISLICSPKKPENATSAAHVEIESGSSAIIDQYAQGQIMVNQRETSIEDDLTRLFRIMRDGSDMEVSLSYVSNIADFEDDKVAKAFSDTESSLKMDLHQIAFSEEHTHRLENALNFLSTHFSEEEPSSHGLVRRKIESLHQEIQRIISSFKQSSETLDTLTKLKEKEKWIDEQHSQRLEAATTLVSEIRNTEDYMNQLKEQICRLQEELKSKEKEFEEYEIKLSSLQKQKKECVWETIEFMEEYEAVKKDKSYVGDGQTKARQEIKKLENQWPSCVADLRKTSFMLGILLKHKP